MTGADKVICRAAAALLLLSLTGAPARAQFAGFGNGADGTDMMTQMAPMLEMMKAKMGKRRFAMLMQTVGPMMSRMMENGSFNGMMDGGGFGGLGGGAMPTGMDIGAGYGGGDMMGMPNGAGGQDIMAMIPQLISLANMGGGGHHRRHRHR